MAINERPIRKNSLICDFNLLKKCKYGDRCVANHFETSFMWQYIEQCGSINENNDNNWQSFSSDLNRTIEKAYCNPRMKKIALK